MDDSKITGTNAYVSVESLNEVPGKLRGVTHVFARQVAELLFYDLAWKEKAFLKRLRASRLFLTLQERGHMSCLPPSGWNGVQICPEKFDGNLTKAFMSRRPDCSTCHRSAINRCTENCFVLLIIVKPCRRLYGFAFDVVDRNRMLRYRPRAQHAESMHHPGSASLLRNVK